MSWGDMPIVHDWQKHCDVCNRKTTWRVVEYKEERIEKCNQCGTRVITVFEKGNVPVDKKVTKKNRTPKEKKRGRPRKGENRDDD